MADKYVQMHPLNETKTALDESVNVFPIIGPDSFKGFDPEAAVGPDVFKPQEKLVSGENIKALAFSEKQPAASLLGSGVLNLPLLDLLYPVGSIYMCAEDKFDGICPIQQLLGGTWVRIKDKFMYAAGDNDEIGATGGSKDAVVVSHAHEMTKAHLETTANKNLNIEYGIGDSIFIQGLWGRNLTPNIGSKALDGDQTTKDFMYGMQGYNGGNPTNVPTNIQLDNYVKISKVSLNTGYSFTPGGITLNGLSYAHHSPGYKLKMELAHEHTIPNHNHTVTSVGVDGTGKNMPPYLVVYMWKRVEEVESEE